LGQKFIVRTDEKSLKSLTDKTIQTPEQQGSLHKFSGFDFVIEYKSGRDNTASNALSRSFMMTLSNQQSLLLQQMHQAIAADVNLSSLKTQCAVGT
jgi:hypothetical protein